MFTADNTPGRTAAELDTLNAALAALLAGLPDAAKREVRHAEADRLRAVWRPSMTVEQLVAAARSA